MFRVENAGTFFICTKNVVVDSYEFLCHDTSFRSRIAVDDHRCSWKEVLVEESTSYFWHQSVLDDGIL